MKLLAVFALLVAVCATVQAEKPTISVGSYNSAIDEFGEGNSFIFFRDDANTTLSVTFLLSGTATFGEDYSFDNSTVRPGLNTVYFAVNVTIAYLNLNPIDDKIEEPTETVIIEIQESINYNIQPGQASYTLSIYDNDEVPVFYVYAYDGITSLAEDDGDNFLAIFDAQDGFLPVSLTFTVSGTATLDQDYYVTGATPLGGGRFSAFNSDAGANVGFRIISDGVFEADETIQVSIDLSDRYDISTRSVVFTIVNDDVDTLPIVGVDRNSGGSAVVEDSGSNYEFTFYRITGDASKPLTISFRVGGTAVYTTNAATDYTVVSGAATFSATRGTVIIPAGSYTQSVVIRPKADSIPEDNENVEFSVLENVLYTIDADFPSSSLVIINDDGAPVVTVATVGTTSVTEGAGQLTFRFTRVGPTSYPLEVYFSIAGTATYPADYVVSGAGLTMGVSTIIPTNADSVDVLISARSDVLLEPRESVVVTVTAAWGSSVYNVGTPSNATAYILDSPPALPVVALVGDESISEGQTKSYRVTRSGILTGDIVVVISFSGTATIKNDYTVSGGILTGNRLVITMPAGKSFTIFSIAAIRDGITDVDETIIIDLVPQSRYIINPAAFTKTVTIIDLDTAGR